MGMLEGDVREVIEKSEWVAIATAGHDGPHLAGTWGDYVRALGFDDDVLLVPAGGLRHTEANLASDPRIELLFASRQVQGSSGGAGKGCLISGRAEVRDTGAEAAAVKARFPWARGALIVHVEHVTPQL